MSFTMIKVLSLNDQEKCRELPAAVIAIFRYEHLIPIVETIVLPLNLVQCLEFIHYYGST